MARWLTILLLIFFTACNSNSPSVMEVDVYNSSADMIGTATLSEQEDGVQVKLELTGLTPGFHGIHVHENSKCEGPDFKSAGSHLNPEGNQHGLMHPEGAHLGDLPNIEADSSGNVEGELMLNEATLKDGKNSIAENEGTSLVITAGQDDGVSQPGGNSGERIACGVIKHDDKSKTNDEPTDPAELNEEEEE